MLCLTLVASCTEGAAPLDPAASGSLRLLLQPTSSSMSGCVAEQPINRIRLSAIAQPGDQVIHRQTFDVPSESQNWTLQFDVPVDGTVARIVVLMELITVSSDGEVVQCSGMTGAIPVQPGADATVAPVIVFDGPADNFRATGIDITTTLPASIVEGQTLQLAAAVTGPGTPRASWRSLDTEVATVDDHGLVTTLRNGTARIEAAAGAVTDVAELVVTQRPTSLRITQASLTAASFGDEVTFTAEVLDPRGAVIPDAAVDWSSENAAIAQSLGKGRFRAAGNGSTTVRAAAAGVAAVNAAATLTVRQQPVRAAVTPATFLFTAVGAGTTFTAQAFDARDNVIPDATFDWSSSAPAVVSVNASGVATAAGRGSATITAVSGAIEGTASAQVTQVVARIELEPGSLRLESIGAEADVAARTVDGSGSTLEDAVVAWSSSDASVATVDVDGTVRAVGNGSATITASAGGVTAQLPVTVEQRGVRILLSAESQRATSLGEVVVFSGAVVDAEDSPLAGAAISWSSDDEAVAASNGNGSFTAVSNGSATIHARSGDLEATGSVIVEQQAARITVAPGSFIFTAIGLSTGFTASAEDARGNVITGAALTWSSTGPAVTVTPDGVATAAAAGTAAVRATAPNGISGSADVTVRQAVASLEARAAELRFTQLGVSAPAPVVARDSRGNVIETPQGITWTSSGAAATVDAAGLVTAAANGTATVTATAGEASAQVRVVVEQQAAAVRIEPRDVPLGHVGQSLSLQASVLDAGESPIPGAAITWSSSDAAVIAVDGNGTVTGMAAGSATITAAHAGLTDAVTVTLTQVAVGMDVDPDVIAVVAGETAAISARLVDAGSITVDGAAFTFVSADPDIATVDANGIVTGVGVGTTLIAVESGAFSQEVAVTVTAPPVEGGGQITGRVLHALSNVGIEGAHVTFEQELVGNGALRRSRIAASPLAATTDEDGRYTSPPLAAGTWTVHVTADGFTATALHEIVVSEGVVEAPTIPLVPFSTQTGAISGRIVNAQTAAPLGGVTVELREGVGSTTGAPIATTATDSDGAYRFADLPAGTYSVRAHRDGYVDGVRTGIAVGGSEIFDQDMSLVAEAATEGEVRIVLTWGADPRDLDSHLTGPLESGGRFHVAYFDQGSLTAPPFASLDVDDTSGHGPETITIAQQFPGTYSYAVHHYSGSRTIGTSGAVVRVFRGNTLIARFEPPNVNGSVWHVFNLNGNTVTPVNTIGGSFPAGITAGSGFRGAAKK